MTIFERIVAREIPADIVHEDDHCVAIRDLHPQAPDHFLVIPKRVISRIGNATADDQALLGHLLLVAGLLARTHGHADNGFRVVINHGPNGGETIPHLHLHVLAGRPMEWPPG